MGALPGVALPVDVATLPAKAGSAAPSTSTPAPAATSADADKQQAVIDAQASVNEAQGALDAYLASVADEKPSVSLADIDAELDRVADSIAAQTSVRPEKDGGVTLKAGGQAGRYLTAAEYRDALTRCTTLSVDASDRPVNPSIGESEQTLAPGIEAPAPQDPATQAPAPQNPVTQAPAPQDPSTPAPAPSNPSVDGEQTPAPGADAPTPQDPATQAPAPQNPVTQDPATQVPSVQVPVTPAASGPAQTDAPASTPAEMRRDTLAATGASGVWVGVGAVAVLVAGIGAVVASRRAKR